MKKYKFTTVDVLVLAVVVLLIIGTFVKFGIRGASAAEPVEFSYTMEITNAPGALADILQVGDKVYDNAGKAAIGVISGIESSTDDINLTITAQGTEIDGGYRVGVYNITSEYCGTYFTKYAIWDGTVTLVD